MGSDGLFWRHVRGSAQHIPSLCLIEAIPQRLNFRPTRRVRICTGGAMGVVENLGQPPIHYLHFAIRSDHHIGRFEIPMDHAMRMGIRDSFRNFLEDGDHPATCFCRSIFDQFRQCFPANELHRQEGPTIRQRSDMMDRRNAGMLKLTGDSSFFKKPPRRWSIERVIFLENLDGNFAMKSKIIAPADDAHAATSDFVTNLEVACTHPFRQRFRICPVSRQCGGNRRYFRTAQDRAWARRTWSLLER